MCSFLFQRSLCMCYITIEYFLSQICLQINRNLNSKITWFSINELIQTQNDPCVVYQIFLSIINGVYIGMCIIIIQCFKRISCIKWLTKIATSMHREIQLWHYYDSTSGPKPLHKIIRIFQVNMVLSSSSYQPTKPTVAGTMAMCVIMKKII